MYYKEKSWDKFFQKHVYRASNLIKYENKLYFIYLKHTPIVYSTSSKQKKMLIMKVILFKLNNIK